MPAFGIGFRVLELVHMVLKLVRRHGLRVRLCARRWEMGGVEGTQAELSKHVVTKARDHKTWLR